MRIHHWNIGTFRNYLLFFFLLGTIILSHDGRLSKKNTPGNDQKITYGVNPSDESCRRITNPNVAFFDAFSVVSASRWSQLVPNWSQRRPEHHHCIRFTLEVLSNAWVSIRLHSPSASRKALDSSPLLSGYNQTTERSFGWLRYLRSTNFHTYFKASLGIP